MTVPQIVTANSITVLIAGKTLVAKSGHPNFMAIKDYLKAGSADVAKLASMFDIPKAIETRSNGSVVIKDSTVYFNGAPLHNTLTTRMLDMLAEGFNIDSLVAFLAKLMQNPSHRAVTGLYDFLAATNIPITPDGDFLAFKKVRDNYYDIHSGTIRNAVGDSPRVLRNQVDEDPDQTCSHGLHVCSESYLPHFGSSYGNRIVIVQVNPADVVAIPRDYNNAKMRCAGYKVIGEVAAEAVAKTFNAPVMSEASFLPTSYITDETSLLASDQTEVIRDVHGVLVTFSYDADMEGWDASWSDADGNDQDDFFEVETLDEAIDEFIDAYMVEMSEYTAEVRWLDEEGELQIETVTVEGDVDYEPTEEEFTDKLSDESNDFSYDNADGARVVNITKGATNWRLDECF
jgi:hypothetical protein